MRTFALIALFGAALIAALILTAPLRVVLEAAGAERMGLSAQSVSGAVWDGRASDVRWGRFHLGEVRAKAAPLSLLVGAPRVEVQMDGEVSGEGALSFSGGDRVVSIASARAPMETLGPFAPMTGTLLLSEVEVRLGPEGCRAARGTISTDALRKSAAALFWEGPDLSGPITCAENGAIVAQMSGLAGSARASVEMRVSPEGPFTLQTRIDGLTGPAAAALIGQGFQPDGEGYVRFDEGSLTDALAN